MNYDLQLLDALTAISEYAASEPLVAAKCRGLMRGYHARWRAAGYVPIAVERVYESPLYNPETQAKSKTFRVAGKIDALANHNGRMFIIDHKTTSQDITDPNSPYWRQLTVEGQVTHYFLLQWLHGLKPDGAVWDVIRKPGISPKKLTKAEHVSATGGTYFGKKLSASALTALQREDRETPEMYEARLANDCTNERPEWYFQRRQVPRMNHEIMEYARELWDHSKEILHTREQQRGTLRLPPRNSGACLLYGTPCNFLGICSGHDTPDSDRWKPKTDVHPELEGQLNDGLHVLTNSRVRCFQTCRRKHYYDFDLGIERHDPEEREAIFFGSAMHEGLRAWWSYLLQPNERQSHDDHGNSAGIGLAADRASDHQEELARGSF